jgi:hypothetical protein
MYLLSYAQTASGPQFSVFVRARLPSGRWEPSGPLLPDRCAATDDRGTGYQMIVPDLGGKGDGWTVMLHADPGPRHDPRWLDLSAVPGGPAVRVDLGRPTTATGAGQHGGGQPRRAPAARDRGTAVSRTAR